MVLILNNGVPKSGSTWVHQILRKGIDPVYPGEKWLNGWENPSVDPKNLKDYVESGEWKGDKPVLIKSHILYSPKFDFLFQEGIYTLVSYRNIPDSVVSWFHHQVRQKTMTAETPEDWYATEGRKFAMRAVAHRFSWVAKPNTIFVPYEDMRADAAKEIKTLFEALNMPMADDSYAQLAKSTQVNLSKDEKPREGRHIRTAGRSTAREEIPAGLVNEFFALQNSIPDLRLFGSAPPQEGAL
ncbi:MAG: sulfotransferase domain-containing protein [Pseudomonadota bacterium]